MFLDVRLAVAVAVGQENDIGRANGAKTNGEHDHAINTTVVVGVRVGSYRKKDPVGFFSGPTLFRGSSTCSELYHIPYPIRVQLTRFNARREESP